MAESARMIHFIPDWRLIPETMNNDGGNIKYIAIMELGSIHRIITQGQRSGGDIEMYRY